MVEKEDHLSGTYFIFPFDQLAFDLTMITSEQAANDSLCIYISFTPKVYASLLRSPFSLLSFQSIFHLLFANNCSLIKQCTDIISLLIYIY